MSAAFADVGQQAWEPVVLSAIPGRARVRLPEWSGQRPRGLETLIRAIPGVRRGQANSLTRNLLIEYDPAKTTCDAIVSALADRHHEIAALSGTETAAPPTSSEQRDKTVRARISVRGIDRDPELARRVVERLQRTPGVRAYANPMTGRVLVEFAKHDADLDELIARVADIELPDMLDEDRPADPLDPKPLIQGATRSIGAALGLGLTAAQQIPGLEGPLVDPNIAAQISGVIGILRQFPFLRNGLRRLFGRNVADLALSLPDIVTQALSNNPLGLAVSGAESLRIFTEERLRLAAWKRYEAHLEGVAGATPGAVIRLETGDRTPLAAKVIEGFGTATGRSGAPQKVAPGEVISAGARLFGGPFVLEMQAGASLTPQPRPAPLTPTLYDRYTRIVGGVSLGYAALTAVLTRSYTRTFAALLLVNPRTAIIGMEAANLDASARVLRAGCTVVGTRPDRTIRRPNTLLLDGPRLITDVFEVTTVFPLRDDLDTAAILAHAGSIALAAGSPWGGLFRSAPSLPATDGHFDGQTATARIHGVSYSLTQAPQHTSHASVTQSEATDARERRILARGEQVLRLHSEQSPDLLALIAFRPRLAQTVSVLVETCKRYHVAVALLPGADAVTTHAVARRAGIPMLDADDALGEIRARQMLGEFVAFVSDGGHAAAVFEASDLAIGLTDGRRPLAARADLIAPDLIALAEIIEAGGRRDIAVRDAVLLSLISNGVGLVWGLRGAPGIAVASRAVYITALAALVDGWYRLRGGERPGATMGALVDPHPEQWGARSVRETLLALGASPNGLSSEQVALRHRSDVTIGPRPTLLKAVGEQLRSPLTGVLAFGAGVSFLIGAPADVALIGATIAANVAMGVWQERKADQVAETLKRLGAATARVLRDGQVVELPAGQVVPGDVLLLATGDRVTADARLIEAQALEVDEAALTGESLPVRKAPDEATDAGRVILEGSDVTTGSGKAVVFAVGKDTRMGSITEALATDDTRQSPLDARLSELLRQVAPIALIGGAIVTGVGFLRTRSLLPQLAIGATVAISAVPEGLPLLTQVSEAGVARRLANHNALTRRLPAVEALGRVDVICTDKTGTLTEGRLILSCIADTSGEQETRLDGAGETPETPETDESGAGKAIQLSATLRAVLLAAALASPRPDGQDAGAHPTDVAIIQGALRVGLGDEVRRERAEELPFDPVRSFHATRTDGAVSVKGAPEVLAHRCVALRADGVDRPLDDDGRQRLLARAYALAEQGLRVLLVASGPEDSTLDNPAGLTALGFVGISDPLKRGVPQAVRRCRAAGVRVIMLTGDHPATAQAIAREAGLLPMESDAQRSGGFDEAIVTGAEIAGLHNGDLDRRLEHAVVIARATPLDKVRIVESLQRHGHTVAMTGDGVNDSPALRLADVGVAMGRGGTEVARQTADVVLADDDFATLVETFVEGRSFWRNIRRSIGLLLGGNLGELGLVVGASALGFAAPLSARQVLVMNMITDILPGLAVALQQPENRDLAGLAREGTTALDKPLRNDVFRRGVFTAAPSLAAYLAALSMGAPAASSVAFASVITTQLGQTLETGWSEGTLTPAMLAAIGGSALALGASFAVPTLRTFLGLALPTPLGWALIGGSTLSAAALSRMFSHGSLPTPAQQGQPQPPVLLLPAPGMTTA
ncbi:MAG: HAD-IC family P-type ATPase [Ktedonobacterales bacterium]